MEVHEFAIWSRVCIISNQCVGESGVWRRFKESIGNRNSSAGHSLPSVKQQLSTYGLHQRQHSSFTLELVLISFPEEVRSTLYFCLASKLKVKTEDYWLSQLDQYLGFDSRHTVIFAIRTKVQKRPQQQKVTPNSRAVPSTYWAEDACRWRRRATATKATWCLARALSSRQRNRKYFSFGRIFKIIFFKPTNYIP